MVFRFHRLFAFTGFAITAFMIKLYATSALRFFKLYAFMIKLYNISQLYAFSSTLLQALRFFR